jgi:hypothetical protein
VPYVRTMKTKSGATAVQFVYLSRLGSRDIEHLWSAHDEAELEAMKAAARQRGSWSSTWALSLRAAGRCRSPSRGGVPAGRPGARTWSWGMRSVVASLRTTCSGVCFYLVAKLM